MNMRIQQPYKINLKRNSIKKIYSRNNSCRNLKFSSKYSFNLVSLLRYRYNNSHLYLRRGQVIKSNREILKIKLLHIKGTTIVKGRKRISLKGSKIPKG